MLDFADLRPRGRLWDERLDKVCDQQCGGRERDVAMAMPWKPLRSNKKLSIGAPAAIAANIDIPIPEILGRPVGRRKFQPPSDIPGDDEALRSANQSSSRKKNRDRKNLLVQKRHRITERTTTTTDAQRPTTTALRVPHRLLGGPLIDGPRERHELRARDQTDHRGAEAELSVTCNGSTDIAIPITRKDRNTTPITGRMTFIVRRRARLRVPQHSSFESSRKDAAAARAASSTSCILDPLGSGYSICLARTYGCRS